MTVAIVYSRALAGVHAPLVTVEVHLAGGLPAFNLVGLPETEVKESRDRVRAALQNALFEFPQRRITVNLAPAELPKESAGKKGPGSRAWPLFFSKKHYGQSSNSFGNHQFEATLPPFGNIYF